MAPARPAGPAPLEGGCICPWNLEWRALPVGVMIPSSKAATPSDLTMGHTSGTQGSLFAHQSSVFQS